MPRIFDNISADLGSTLGELLRESHRADFCVGYFNLRGWRIIAKPFTAWSEEQGHLCRLLVGMPISLEDELRTFYSSMARSSERPDNSEMERMRTELALHFRRQLEMGLPSASDESVLTNLIEQIKRKALLVKLHLRFALHAKLYICHREDNFAPIISYVGSSNLTFGGLSRQGELNVEVLDNLQNKELSEWFDARWSDECSIDLSDDLTKIIAESWAGGQRDPYLIYLKIAYHLSQEARAGLSQFTVPKKLKERLLPFQESAVRIAARHLAARDGVLLADVVGLGKTLMATALAKVFQDDLGYEVLVLCPKNLVGMWDQYRIDYSLNARVIPYSEALKKLPDLQRFRIVIVDESHNLRSSEAKIHQAVKDYVARNDSKCILLSATPYNKAFVDLGYQLSLFIPMDRMLQARPERLLKELGAAEFSSKHQCQPDTLQAFMHSEYADDWQELLRHYMVRRTRSFVKANYAKIAPDGREFLTFADGTPFFFPKRKTTTLKFPLGEDEQDQYSRLFTSEVVDVIDHLALPRYGLAGYVDQEQRASASGADEVILQNLKKAGKRLIGFCRTNLFKRLESSGSSFLKSLKSHAQRNRVYIYALKNELPLPIGTLDALAFNTAVFDDEELTLESELTNVDAPASKAYELMTKVKRLKWAPTRYFLPRLLDALEEDTAAIEKILNYSGPWRPAEDQKLALLEQFIKHRHGSEKLLIFTQFADTAAYLERELNARGVTRLALATGASPDPTLIAQRFSPVSNERRLQVSVEDELRVLISTDVLSEGQNLQDCHVVVNYDIPWAIIRLIQRVGRIDRLGQQAAEIQCITFMPAEGVELIIGLRQKVRRRLQENAEVVGTDEFYGIEDEIDENGLRELYTEKSSVLEEEDDNVDLTSRAYEIWKQAIAAKPGLAQEIPNLPDVIYSTKTHEPDPHGPEGAIVFVRTAEGNDVLAWADRSGSIVHESQTLILAAAACSFSDKPAERWEDHHEMVAAATSQIIKTSAHIGGQLGSTMGARYRTYEKLRAHLHTLRGSLFGAAESEPIQATMESIYRYPLTDEAKSTLNRQLRLSGNDKHISEIAIRLHSEGKLCLVPTDQTSQEPQIICSLGLRGKS